MKKHITIKEKVESVMSQHGDRWRDIEHIEYSNPNLCFSMDWEGIKHDASYWFKLKTDHHIYISLPNGNVDDIVVIPRNR